MLGFSAFSEVPLSQSYVAIAAIGILSSAASQGYAGSLDYEGKAYILFDSISANTNVAIDFDAKAAINVVSAIANININDIVDADAQARITPSAVVASFDSSNVDYDAKAFIATDNTNSLMSINSIDFIAKANITTSTISVTGTVEDPAYIWGNSRVYPTSVIGKFKLKLNAPIPNSFPYEDYADAYNPTRVLYVLKYESVGTETVFIAQENFTVTVDPIVTSATDTVFIAPESFVVTIPPYIGSSTTIFIDR